MVQKPGSYPEQLWMLAVEKNKINMVTISGPLKLFVNSVQPR